jgi:DNA mismatch repair protein MutS
MKSGKSTPAMKQYMETKNQYPDCLILFRMGDFYETFYEDAVLAAKTLGITLTKRGFRSGPKIPLAGIPYHSIDNFLPKLVRAGIKVAICEQLEDPKKAKGVVKRGVTRIVTAGTIIEPNILTEESNNYLVSLYIDGKVGLSYVDLSTGEFNTTELEADQLANEIIRLKPAEIIVPYSNSSMDEIKKLKDMGLLVNSFEERFYMQEHAKDTLLEHFKVASLDGYGIGFRNLCVVSSAALLNYLLETQKKKLDYINKISYYSIDNFMVLDRQTIRNLELVANLRTENPKNSLLWVLDRTNTPMGSRLIRKLILSPLLDAEEIKRRIECVSILANASEKMFGLKNELKQIKDIERLISRINYGTANARDLLVMKQSLERLPELIRNLPDKQYGLFGDLSGLDLKQDLAKLLDASVNENAPATVREGELIKRGYSDELDELHKIKKNAKEVLLELESKEKEKTGIKTLKVGFNKVFGYFFEVSKNYLSNVPPHYVRKQTRVNGERFITEDLKQLEEKILGVEDKIVELEYTLFSELISRITENTKEIQEIGRKVAMLDCLVSFSEVSIKNNYCRPSIDDEFSISLKGCRHPVIEQIEEMFIPNDLSINKSNRTMIITGPNMAGKSTFMRQIALVSLMAQIGCFVPAKSAKLSIVDRIFTRIGATDDLTSGQSTFMVEMAGVSLILNNATPRSLILMDEIGRGTSTFDGISIAWSVAEFINSRIGAKTLFATHYHVLTKLAKHDGIENYNIAVKEDKNDIIFLRKIRKGGTDKSYGVHVAKLAGMPDEVILKAQEIQFKLEEEDTMRERIVVDKKREDDFIKMTKLRQKTLFDHEFLEE